MEDQFLDQKKNSSNGQSRLDFCDFINKEQQNCQFQCHIKTQSKQQQEQKLKCQSNNQAHYACISNECQSPGLICMDIKCSCKTNHQKCYHILIDRVLKSIHSHIKKPTKTISQSYQYVYQQINKMIDKLSLLRQKLQIEQQYFGLKKQQIKLMETIRQSKINQINGNMIHSIEYTFDTTVVVNQVLKSKVQKQFNLILNKFSNLCFQMQIQSFPIYINSKPVLRNDPNPFDKSFTDIKFLEDSSIVQQEQQIVFLQEHLSQALGRSHKSISSSPLKAKLLFRASQHNFESDKFHKYCDGIEKTLIIAQTQFSKIIGGYTSLSWDSSGLFKQDESKKTFLFSLSQRQIYNCIRPQYSIKCNKNNGPIFGGNNGLFTQYDLALRHGCNKENKASAGFPKSYGYDFFRYQSAEEANQAFIGNQQHQFYVKQYEVYQILDNDEIEKCYS